MRITRLLGRTIKDSPKDVELPSHRLLLRAGFIRQFSTGVYGLLPLAKRSIAKIEAIVREEMNQIDGQEVSLPCLGTKELWQQSGRYQSIGSDMFRLTDRHDHDMLLCMTHEEPAVHLARQYADSYKQFPFMIYQIQSKFRDERRPRGGLIRLREFTMKDGYSFHTSEDDLKKYYLQVHTAYNRIFKRLGIKKFIDVQSDNGIFGGEYSHEFMSLTSSGEDTLFICSNCDYKANKEVAFFHFDTIPESSSVTFTLEKIATPNIYTISDLCNFLKIDPNQTIKTVMFETIDTKPQLVLAFVRGDKDVLQVKVEKLVKKALAPAKESTIRQAGAVPGYTGPAGIDLNHTIVVIDRMIENATNMACGANIEGFHYCHFNMTRDFLQNLSSLDVNKVLRADIVSTENGDLCPLCKNSLQLIRGIEIGNIFHLGTKYSKSMEYFYLDESNKPKPPIMGCYGIGITRCLAAIIEDSHDNYGIIFPMSVSPYEVHLCALDYNKEEIKNHVDTIYEVLKNSNISVLFDDRNAKAGFQFNDADLIGIPIRIVLSSKTFEAEVCEFQYRDRRSPRCEVPLNDLVQFLKEKIRLEYECYKS